MEGLGFCGGHTCDMPLESQATHYLCSSSPSSFQDLSYIGGPMRANASRQSGPLHIWFFSFPFLDLGLF